MLTDEFSYLDKYRKNPVLVLGGSGFIGTNLVNLLEFLGFEISATYFSNFPRYRNNKVEYIQLDARELENNFNLFKNFQNIFICSAITSGSKVIRNNPMLHFHDNNVLNTRILEAASNAKVKRILFISSSTVYPNTDKLMCEDDVTGEYFPSYEIVASMKRYFEKAFQIYAKGNFSSLETVIVRPSNAYGEFDDFEWETSKVVPALIRKFVEKQNPIEVWGDGNDIKDFIYCEDLVKGLIHSMYKSKSGEIFNIASGQSITIKNLVKILTNISYSKSNVTYNSSIPSMIPVRRIDTQKAENQLGFKAQVNFQEGIEKTYRWYLTQKT